MFSSLGERLQQTIKNLMGRGRLTDENIQETLRAVRISLLEADVSLSVVKPFIEHIREKAVGEQIVGSLTPGQELVKIVHDELVSTLGASTASLNYQTAPPLVILMAGLQGCGKTTTAAKLANLIQTQHKKKVLLVSADTYRPAAIQQLAILALQINAGFFQSEDTQKPEDIAKRAVEQARKQLIDVVIIDTAGRLHIDQDMMNEIKTIHQIVHPQETLFAVDSMTGQVAADTAKAFDDAIPLTGVVLTKTDGDARGGAALSVWGTIHKPIKFIGTGEKLDALETFHPERIASRILGMGDLVTLAEEVHQKVDQKKAEKLAKKIAKGKLFDLEDFLEQLNQMNKLGGISSLIGKLPGVNQLPSAIKNQMNDSLFVKMKAMIQSMTPRERHYPDLIRHSQKQRIILGSGTTIQDLNRLLKQFTQMQKMMKKLSRPGGKLQMLRQLNQVKNLMGNSMENIPL